MSTVAEVMTRNVVTVRAESTLSEAMACLSTQHISGAAVTDHRRKLIGVVSRSDIMDAEAEVQDQEIRGRFLDETLVRDVMTSPALTIGSEMDLREAALAMEYGDVHRLFVESGGVLVGVVSRSDVSRALATGRA